MTGASFGIGLNTLLLTVHQPSDGFHVYAGGVGRGFFLATESVGDVFWLCLLFDLFFETW